MTHLAPEQPPNPDSGGVKFLALLVAIAVGLALACACLQWVAPWVTVTH